MSDFDPWFTYVLGALSPLALAAGYFIAKRAAIWFRNLPFE